MRNGLNAFRLFSGAVVHHVRRCCGMAVLIVFCAQIIGCAPMTIPAYKAEPFDTYKNQRSWNNLHIAVMPMTDKEEQKKYFGKALNKEGILPVFIIAENRSSSQRFMLRDNLISLKQKTSDGRLAKPSQKDAADDSDLEGLRGASQLVGSVFLSLALAKNSVDTKAIQDSMFDKTLYTQSVLPGKTAEGFAFFKLPDDKMNMEGLLLHIQASDMDTKAVYTFEFAL